MPGSAATRARGASTRSRRGCGTSSSCPRRTPTDAGTGTPAAGRASSDGCADDAASIAVVAKPPTRALVVERDGRWHGSLGAVRVEASTERRCVAALRRATGVAADALVVEIVPELVGVTEAAALLGWDRRRVATYVDRGAFPRPVAELASGRVWRAADVEAFAATRRTRRPRRPPRRRAASGGRA